jgi:hypothetical protein
VGTGASLGDLEFRVGSGFGTSGVPGPNTLVATMTKDGNTAFGNNPLQFSSKVGIAPSFNQTGLSINGNSQGFSIITEGSFNPVGGSLNTIGGQDNFGLILKSGDSVNSNGVLSVVYNSDTAIGLRGFTEGQGSFNAAVYGESQNNGNHFAGFFDGDIVTTSGVFLPSDERLKNNIVTETKALDKIAQLRPVTYQYKDLKTINLSKGLQHGFISQEVAKVFPELTKDIVKPVFDKEGKKIDEVAFKSINYDGLISVLTASVQELHQEVKNLKEELSAYKTDENLKKASIQENNFNANEFYLDQNIPNPFTDQTTISYRFPKNINNASIMIFDLNGKLIHEYPITKNNGAIIIKASEVGKGMFLYSIAYQNQEMITKKMIIR